MPLADIEEDVMAEHPGLALPARLLADGLDRVRENVHEIVAGRSEAELGWQPTPRSNSIGWLVWHLTRVLDDHLSGVATSLGHTGAEQVWLRDGWQQRFALPYPPAAHGYGQTSEQVAAFRAGADLLLGYHDATSAHARTVLASLRPEHYDTVVDQRWDPPVTAAVRLVSVLDDCCQHVGQAAYLVGLRVAWQRAGNNG
ncbi:MAG: mycothiol transferase [Actinomycetales bacterium]